MGDGPYSRKFMWDSGELRLLRVITRGNIFEMLGTCRRYMREDGCNELEVGVVTELVFAAKSYEQACAIINMQYPVLP